MTVKPWLCLLFSFLSVCFCAEWKIDLEYSFNDFGSTYPLGSIELRRNFDGNYTGTLKATQDKYFGKRLLESQNTLYAVRAKSSTQPGETFLTTSDPCLYLQSSLFHLFWISINPERQTLNTITVFPDAVTFGRDDKVVTNSNVGIECSQRLENINPSVEERIKGGVPNGVVTVSERTTLPSPDTTSFVQKLERDKRAKQHGADADNRSFLAKYWMYIVPIVIFAVISNAVNPENAEGGGSQ